MSGETFVSESLSFNTTTPTEHDFNAIFGSGSSIDRIVIKTTADVYLNFNQPANTENFVLSASDNPLMLEDFPATTISAKGVNNSGTLYFIAIR